MRRGWLGALAVWALGAIGCAAPEHLTEGYGESFRAALERQAIRPAGCAAEPVSGLDSQEAAIISESYRQSLLPEGQSLDDDDDQLIYLAPRPRTNPDNSRMPPPSVPPDQR
ncbi:MAG: hypothetical protein ACOX6T_09140 [Myxococcales bacterium]|jgi:hypothetical protein